MNASPASDIRTAEKRHLYQVLHIARTRTHANIGANQATLLLRDLLLLELGGGEGDSLAGIVPMLRDSIAQLRTMRILIREYRADMKRGELAPPVLNLTHLADIGPTLARSNLVELNSWNVAVYMLQQRGYDGVLVEIDGRATRLINHAADILESVPDFEPVALKGKLGECLDDPEGLPRKFAALNAAWSSFNLLMDAFSLCSSEMRHRVRLRLVETETDSKAA